MVSWSRVSKMTQSTLEFLGFKPGRHPDQWEFPITPKVTGGRGSLFGGVGLAAGIVALEAASGKPVVWATGQYLAITQQPVTLDLDVHLPAVGRKVTQGRVLGHIGEQEIITVIGAAGERPSNAEGSWVKFPEALPPDECPVIERDHDGATLHDHVELRLARGAFGFNGFGSPTADGRSLLWARMRDVAHDSGALAIIADFMPSVLGNALGTIAYCTSLDNTIRFGQPEPSDWILCDNHMEYVGNGFGYGTMHLWSQAGTLLATASQSMIVRVPDPPIAITG